MPFTTAGKDLMLDGLPSTLYVSAHSALPDNAGSNEISGGTYARQSVTIAASSGANRDSTTVPELSIPASSTITHLGYWSAATGGTFLGYKAILSETFNNAGTLTVTDLDLTLVDPA